MADSAQIEAERARRAEMWAELNRRGPPSAATPQDISDVGIRPMKTGQGIYRDKGVTGALSPQGVTVSLLDIGDVYDDAFSDNGGRYYYPQTKRPAGRDEGEIEATKNLKRFDLPVFVVLGSSVAGRRDVRRATVHSWDDDERVFDLRFSDAGEKPVSDTGRRKPPPADNLVAAAVELALKARSKKLYKPAALLVALDMIDDGASPEAIDFEELSRRFDDFVRPVDTNATGKAWEPFSHLSTQSAGEGIWELRRVGEHSESGGLPEGRPKSLGRRLERGDTATMVWPLSDVVVTKAGRARVRQALLEALEEDGLGWLGREAKPAPAPLREPMAWSPVERFDVTHTGVERGTTSGVVVRRESALRQRYIDYLEAQGHEVAGMRLTPKGTSASLPIDLFDKTAWRLIEAKADASRSSVRMALGQLLDYVRWVEGRRPSLAVLLPERPAQDLVDLLVGHGVAVVWEGDGDEFSEEVPK